jgi:hypothetical protein
MNKDIVNDALKYYDQNNEKYMNIKKKIKFVKHAVADQRDIEGVKLIFYDQDMKEIFTSRVEVLAKYYINVKVWTWGFSIPSLDRSLTALSRKIFLYGTDIDISNPANILLKNELITSRFVINDEVQIDIHCALASYLAKKPFIFQWKDFIFTSDVMKVKGEFDDEKTDVIYYSFIVDPPDV